jgi:uracil-DNA glycosylase
MQPKVVVALGKVAYRALSGENVSITSIAGSKIEMDGFVCIPTLHPASILYGDDGGRKRDIIKQSIRTALEIAGV